MSRLIVNFNDEYYTPIYNEQTGFYEVNLTAPSVGGVYKADVTYISGEVYEDSINIQVLAKEEIKIVTNKVFMWIFDYDNFSVKDIVEISDYEINIDEETNASSTIRVLKKTEASAKDIIAIKKNNEVIYWGIIDNIQNEDGKKMYEYTTKYITNLFDRTIVLENESLIKTSGVEDFIEDAITNNFIDNEDTFINKKWLHLEVKSHTTKQISVSNVENNIYNLHTWITNCTQNYDIVYNFSISTIYDEDDSKKKLVMTIENKELDTELVDVTAQAVSNYTEVFETNIVSKVVVLTSTDTYTLYLRTDRTTTTDMTDEERADGDIETVYTENYEDAEQTALDKIKSNSYNHNITFNYYDRFIKIGTPIAIKTKESVVYNTYISAVKITPSNFYEYTCGNIRINFIDKLLKERRN